MLNTPDAVAQAEPRLLPGADHEAYEVIEGAIESGLLLICDHASNAIPAEFDNLGLGAAQRSRHIAYDIGAGEVTRKLAAALGVPAVMSRYSRLLIDPNRGDDDPTRVLRISDGTVVPGNAKITPAEIEARVMRFYEPYDSAIAAAIAHYLDAGVVPALLSIHSFTPAWKEIHRPWHSGVLFDRDRRFADLLIDALASEPGHIVGANEPYSGELDGDTMNRHGTRCGLPHGLLEIRQDLISTDNGIEEWTERLTRLLPAIVERGELHRIASEQTA